MVGKPIDDTAAIARIRTLLEQHPERSRRSAIIKICGNGALRRIEAKMKRQDDEGMRTQAEPLREPDRHDELPIDEEMLTRRKRQRSIRRLYEENLPWSFLGLMTATLVCLWALLHVVALHHPDLQTALLQQVWPVMSEMGIAAVGNIAWWTNWIAFAVAVTVVVALDESEHNILKTFFSLVFLFPTGLGFSLGQMVPIALGAAAGVRPTEMPVFGALVLAIAPIVVVSSVSIYLTTRSKLIWNLRIGFTLAFVGVMASGIEAVTAEVGMSATTSDILLLGVATAFGVAATRVAAFIFGIDGWKDDDLGSVRRRRAVAISRDSN